MGKFKKKSSVIEAFKWMEEVTPDWWREESGKFNVDVASGTVFIPTETGTYPCQKGDYIIRNEVGDIYSRKPDVFENIYEPVDA